MKTESKLLKYKSQICNITKDPSFSDKKFAYGFTSTVYKIDDYVIKETYLSKSNLENEDFFQEIEANIFFREHPDLQHYAIKFEGFEICDDKVYTKYEYAGEPLLNTILDYTPKQLNEILEKTLENLKVLHRYIIHGDVHIGNVFVKKDKLGNIENVFFGDWGRAVIKGEPVRYVDPEFYVEVSEKADYRRFLKDFKNKLLHSHFFKNVNVKEALKLLADKGKKKLFFDTLDLKLSERKEKYPYRPKELLEKLRPFFFYKVLYKVLEKTYKENFIIKKCKFSKSMYNFLNKLNENIKLYN
jgi:hypothetical protein